MNTESSLHELGAQDFSLLIGKLVILVHFDGEWVLVGIIVQVNETIVEKETSVALLAIRVKDLFSTFDVFKSLNDETLTVVGVTPASLSGALVVKHVSVRDEAVGLDTFNLDAKDTTSNHHADLRVLLEGELTIVGNFVANRVVVLLDVSDFLRNLVLEWTSFKPCALFLSVENWEVIKGFGQDVDVLVERSGLLSAFLHDVGGQERMLR